MDKPVHTEGLRGYTIKLFTDHDTTSPSESADKHAFLVYGHRDFTVNGPSKERAQDVHRDKKKWAKTHHVHEVYAYIHSGVRLGLSTAGMVDVQWDVSMCGYLLITKDKSEIPRPDEYAQSMIDEWNQYLSGDVYGYVIADGNGEHVDSCWGFFGFDYAKTEARNAVPTQPFEHVFCEARNVQA
jgi:hypothetical protein